MPEIFRLSRNRAIYDENGVTSSDNINHHPREYQAPRTASMVTQASNILSALPTARDLQSRTSNGAKAVHTNHVYDQELTSHLQENASLLDLVQSFHDVNNTPMNSDLDMSLPYMDDASLEIDDMDSIWNIKWTGALL